MKHKKLNQLDRDRIEALLRRGHTQAEIARVLGVNRSTISREIHRLKRTEYTYQASCAQHDAGVKRGRSKYQGMKIESMFEVKTCIIQELQNKRSPDEIAGRLSLEVGHVVVGKDAIYKWLYSSWGQQYW